MNRIEAALAKLQRERNPGRQNVSLGRVVEGRAEETAQEKDVVRRRPRTAPPQPSVGASTGAAAHTDTDSMLPHVVPVHHDYRLDRSVEVDAKALRHAGLIAPKDQEQRVSEEYRQIKRPLLANAAGRGTPVERANVVMLGSAVPGEGKTFTCVNLCLSLSREKDWSVVLVDGDVAKPHLTRLFGLDHEPGFLDLLRDPETAFDDYVLSTNIPGFAILPAGRGDQHNAELLGSARMDALAQYLTLSDPRRLVVFDSPPLLATSEAQVLAAHMGQVVLVVRAGHTAQQRVQEAIDKVDPSKALSLILNQTEMGEDVLGYGGAYGYPRSP